MENTNELTAVVDKLKKSDDFEENLLGNLVETVYIAYKKKDLLKLHPYIMKFFRDHIQVNN